MTVRPVTRASSEGVHHHVFPAFGTTVDLAVCGRPVRPFAEVESHLLDLHHRFSRFIHGSELDVFNGAAGTWVDVSGEMARLLQHALRVAVLSSGLVNIATTNALLAAGYVDPWPAPWRPSERPGGSPGQSIAPLTEVLEVRGHRVRLCPGLRVDFGGIAKGLWADDAVELLGPNAAASLGGDVSARGAGPNGDGWPVGLPTARTLVLIDGGLATSGTSKRRSGSASHVIDPRTGRPADIGLVEISVLAGSACDAEWLAKVALLASGDAGAVLDRHDAHVVAVHHPGPERSEP